jgi:hypothetical protein
MLKSPLKLLKKKRSGEAATPRDSASASATAQVVERASSASVAAPAPVMAPPSKAAAVPFKEPTAAALEPTAAAAKGGKAAAAAPADATKRPTKKLESLQALRYITALQVSQSLGVGKKSSDMGGSGWDLLQASLAASKPTRARDTRTPYTHPQRRPSGSDG